MGFTEAVQTCLRKYATFSGRAVRSEYWYFVLFTILASIALSIMDTLAFGFDQDGSGPLGSLFSLAMLIPGISVTVRRLHDLDRTGWWWWLWLLPIIGWIILLIWHCSKGTPGANRFGDDPFGAVRHAPELVSTHESTIPRVSRDD